jgi:hypothetical protein
LKISPRADGSSAILTLLDRNVTEADIQECLARNDIIAGIDWTAIRGALAEAARDGRVRVDIPAVAAPEMRYRMFYFDDETAVDDADVRRIAESLGPVAETLDCLRRHEDIITPVMARFLKQDECFWTFRNDGDSIDIYGSPRPLIPGRRPPLRHSPALAVTADHKKIEYRAIRSGYVQMNRDGEIDIVSPFMLSTDRMTLFFLQLPLCHGRAALLDELVATGHRRAAAPDGEIPIEREALSRLLASGKSQMIMFRQGFSPVPGNDAVLRFSPALQPNISEDAFGRIDIRESSDYLEIREGTLIAEKIDPQPGAPGETALGEPIPGLPGNDVPFKAGENIIDICENGKHRYVAGKSGALRLSSSGAAICEVLHVSGNIGLETGNLRSGKSIVANGSIESGFIVECGGDLTVHGGIENGAVVKCTGHMVVRGGVFGEQTDIIVRGNAEIGFIQGGRIQIDGNLKVNGFIYNAQVVCGDALVVKGAGLTGNAKGCVIGGTTVAMRSMELASAGSDAVTTNLTCGINPATLELIAATQTRIAALNKTAVRLRKTIGIDLTGSDAAEQMRKSTNKELIRTLLLELKKVSQEQGELMKKLPFLEKYAMFASSDQCFIAIKHQLIPVVAMRICKASRTIFEPAETVICRYREKNGVVMAHERLAR